MAKLKINPDALADVLHDYVAAKNILGWLAEHEHVVVDVSSLLGGDDAEERRELLAREYATNSKAERAALDAALTVTDEDC